mmetsp:Transcript_20879/g.19026  ORF Transcript_20879/g.19026 Transcript_20879/m.19026 type:complete len:652 (+) Transcript_20879:19-1974(+)
MNVGVEASYFFIKEDEDNDILNKDLQNKPLSDGSKPREIKTSPPIYEVDFVGNGSYQVTQLNLLKKRNIELIKDTAAKLSARGIIHRPFEQFHKDVRNATAVIQTALQNEILTSVKTSSKKGHKAARRPAYLFNSYFQRGLGYERLNQLEDALNDYNVCLEIDSKHAPAYFNRAGILHAQGKLDEAIDDLSKAIFYDPSNPTYRSNRSLLYREKGIYLEAIDEIMIARAIKSEPHIASELKAGRDVHIDSDTLKSTKIEADPIVTALTGPKYQRTFKNIIPVVDFLCNLKFFSKFHNDRDFLRRIAIKLELEIYNKDDIIFHEGHVGHHFYMILDGEVSIVKTKVYKKSKLIENITLVKLFRGQTFGETALDGNGLRTAGAVATQQTYLLVLHERDYHGIMSKFKTSVRKEVYDLLSTVLIFQTWNDEKLIQLANSAIIEQYGPNYNIIKMGDTVTHLCIIKRGMVKLLKTIDKPTPPTLYYSDLANPEYNIRTEEPGMWILDNNWKSKLEQNDIDYDTIQQNENNNIDFTIGILATGQYFNETAILNPNSKSIITVSTITTVEVYKFPSDVLLSLGIRFDSNSINALSDSLELYNPSNDKVSNYYCNKYLWEARKIKIIENIRKKNPKILPMINNNTTSLVNRPMKYTSN